MGGVILSIRRVSSATPLSLRSIAQRGRIKRDDAHSTWRKTRMMARALLQLAAMDAMRHDRADRNFRPQAMRLAEPGRPS
jgi:hypothetical protein